MISFAERVYRAVKSIPRGKVATYGAVALAVGVPGASRAVGNALNKNPFIPTVPCHRVIRSDGSVGGYASGTSKKEKLLMREGVSITKHKISLKKYGVYFND